MTHAARVALAGIGNNVSALVQRVYYYRSIPAQQPDTDMAGIRRASLGGFVEDASVLLKSPPGTSTKR